MVVDPRLAAMDMLARREHSALELRQKLVRKGYATEGIESVLAQLASQGLQSDARYAEAYARSRMARGFGPLRISQALERAGVEAALITQVLAELESNWYEQAKAVWAKKFHGQLPETWAERCKQQQFLQYRGFTAEQIEPLF